MVTKNHSNTTTSKPDNQNKTLSKSFEEKTYIEVNNYLYNNLKLNISSIFILATIIFWELSRYIGKATLTIWYAIVLIILAIRFAMLIWFYKTNHNTKLQNLHYIVFLVGSSLSAIMWGILGSILMPTNILYQAFILIMISGILAGSTIGLGARYLASMLYILFSLGPVIIWEGIQVFHGEQMYEGIFLAMTFYLFYSGITAFKSSNLILNNIHLKNQNLNLLADLKHYLRQIELFSQLGELLEKCRNYQQIGEACKKYLPSIFPEFSGGIFLLSESDNTVKLLNAWNDFFSTDRYLEFFKDACLTTKTKTFYMSHGLMRCNHCPKASEFYVCIPLQTSLKFFGVLHLKLISHTFPQKEQFILAQKDLLTRIAANISFALSTIKYQKLLEEEATEDTLTGLYNRRYLDRYFKTELARSKRKSTSILISIVMIDIDHFKNFNDQYGHAIGDQVLYELAQLLKKNVRGTDFACRYGGEEFLLILPDTGLDLAVNRAEQIRADVKHISLLKDGKVITNIAVSIGVALFPDHGNTQARVIEAADKALYRAKTEGRDRVCIAV